MRSPIGEHLIVEMEGGYFCWTCSDEKYFTDGEYRAEVLDAEWKAMEKHWMETECRS